MVSCMFDHFWSFVRCLGVSAMALFGCSLWAACSDAGTYDVEDYTLLADRTGGMFAGSMYRSRDTLAYFRVLDLSLLPDEAATTGEISSARAWFWGELDVAADEPMRLLVDIPANAAPSSGYTVDGEDWITERAAGFSGTTLINISEDNFRRGLFVPASILNVFRIR